MTPQYYNIFFISQRCHTKEVWLYSYLILVCGIGIGIWPWVASSELSIKYENRLQMLHAIQCNLMLHAVDYEGKWSMIFWIWLVIPPYTLGMCLHHLHSKILTISCMYIIFSIHRNCGDSFTPLIVLHFLINYLRLIGWQEDDEPWWTEPTSEPKSLAHIRCRHDPLNLLWQGKMKNAPCWYIKSTRSTPPSNEPPPLRSATIIK